MLLKSLTLHNIRSYTDVTINFPLGSTLLAGDIGCGKSTILMAVDFALFGIRRGEISGSDLLRHGKNSGYVRLEFEVNGRTYAVQRRLDRKKNINQAPGSLVVDGIEFEYMPTELTAKILELLSYPQEIRKGNSVFRYTVYTPQEEMKHILLYAEDRLNILRKIFNIDKYGRIRNNTATLLTELRSMKRELDSSVRDIEALAEEKKKDEEETSKIIFEIRHYESLLADIDLQMEQALSNLNSLKSEMAGLMLMKSELSTKEAELSGKKTRIRSVETEIDETSRRIAEMDRTLAVQLRKPDVDEHVMASEQKALEADKDGLIRQRAIAADEIRRLRDILGKKICSFCGQEVHDTDTFESNIKNKQQLVTEIDMKTAEIKGRIETYAQMADQWKLYKANAESRRTVERLRQDAALRRVRYEEEKSMLESDTRRLSQEVSALVPSLERYEDVKSIYDGLEKSYGQLVREKLEHAQRRSRLEQRREDVMKHINRLANDIEKKQMEKKRMEGLTEIITWLDNGFMGMMETMEQHVMLALQYEFNTFFQSWFELIIQDNINVRIDENFSPIISQYGFETEYSNLSGGEKTSVALAYRLALNRVINSISENVKTKDIIILDEPTDGFSNDQLDKLRDVINQLQLQQIIIVSHEPKIETFVDNVIRVYKDSHVSRIEHQ